MNWDRFDIVEAYWCYMVDWNKGGMTERCHVKGRTISMQTYKLQFRPRLDLSSDTLTDNGRAIYDALVAIYQ